MPLIDVEPYIHHDAAEPETPQDTETTPAAQTATAEQDVKPAEPHPLDGGPEETSS